MSLFLENIYADKYLREIIRNVASGDSDTWIGFSKHIGRIVAFPLEVIKFTVYIHTSICNAFEWDNVEYATRHLYFPYTHESLSHA